MIVIGQASSRESRSRSILDHCITIQHFIEKYATNCPIPLYAAFVGLKTAFDSIKKLKLWASLEASSKDSQFILLLHGLHNNTLCSLGLTGKAICHTPSTPTEESGRVVQGKLRLLTLYNSAI